MTRRRRAAPQVANDDLFGRRFAVAHASLGVVALLAGLTFVVGLSDRVWRLVGDLFVGGLVLARLPFADVVVLIADLVAAVAFLAAAALIYWRRPRSSFALFLVIALVLRATWSAAGLETLASRLPDWAGIVAAVRAIDGICALLFLLIFPTGTFVPRSAALVWLAWTAWVVGTLGTPELNPVLQLGRWWAGLVVAGLALYGLAAQVYRHRRIASAYQRVQTKWIVYGLAVYVVVFAAQQLLPIAIPVLGEAGTTEHVAYLVVGSVATDVAAMFVPATILIAVFRAGFLDIDLIINKTVTYFVTTAILAAAFNGGMAGTQFVLTQATGHSTDVIGVLIALGVGLAFGPVKAYVEGVVTRRLRPA